MKKKKMMHVLHYVVLILIPILWALFAKNDERMYGSLIDWTSQHTAIPEIYRQTFYETHDLIPEFIPQLGAGTNGFNYSYYGLLSPIFLPSYFLPMVPMESYVIVTSLICVMVSAILMYRWVLGRYGNRNIAFLCGILFILASPMLFHTHKHIMFINYFPFLMLAFMGLDQLVDSGKKRLLILSVLLMILTSYFYSVAGIFVLSIYFVFRKIECGELKTQWFSYIIAIAAACMLSAFITFPSLASILSGRGDVEGSSAASIHDATGLADLLIPDFAYFELLYSNYSMGLTIFALILLVFYLLYQKKSFRFLSATVLVVITFPVFQWALNGTLYIREKSLIPFLPLVLLFIAEFFAHWNGELQQKENQKKMQTAAGAGVVCGIILIFVQIIGWDAQAGLVIKTSVIRCIQIVLAIVADICLTIVALIVGQRTRKPQMLAGILILAELITCISLNGQELFVKKSFYNQIHSDEKAVLADVAAKEAEESGLYYRSADLTAGRYGTNVYYNEYFLQTSMYSSMYNKWYQHLLLDELHTSNPSNNRITLTSVENYLFQTFMGARYVIDKGELAGGYEEVEREGNYVLGKNENAFPLGYASSSLMKKEEYDSLTHWDKQCALLQYIILPAGEGVSERNEADSLMKQMGIEEITIPKLPLATDLLPDEMTGEEREWYIISADKRQKITVDMNLTDKILFLHLRVRETENDAVSIICNGAENRLNNKYSTYPNLNENFYYVITGENLEINLGDKEYEFLVEAAYTMPLDAVQAWTMDYDEFKIKRMDSNEIAGSINVTKDGYFTLNIPYDTGFTAYVDGKEQEIEIVNSAFMGFELSAGEHEIKFIYHAPLYRAGVATSLAGVALCAVMIVIKKKKGGYL
ncbi:MAG: hypothetical protein E7269_05310 [Lachnospiraceae bacterium]|nr:hypothetical protein [Lachnospiraceae bacterium]